MLTSFISLALNNTSFKVNSKRGALDINRSPVARIVLILTYYIEILARLMILSVFCYTSSDVNESGRVNLMRSMVMFYGHVTFCFVLNIVFNDLSFKLNWKQPMFYMEALINAFSSIFTYSNFTIYNIQDRQEDHRPSFTRQIIFQTIFFLEFVGMLVYSVLHQPASIQDENGDRIPISECWSQDFLYSVILLYCLGLVFRCLYYRVHPWMVSMKPSLKMKVFGRNYNLGNINQECIFNWSRRTGVPSPFV